MSKVYTAVKVFCLAGMLISPAAFAGRGDSGGIGDANAVLGADEGVHLPARDRCLATAHTQDQARACSDHKVTGTPVVVKEDDGRGDSGGTGD